MNLCAPAAMQPSINDMRWVSPETCGSRAIKAVAVKKIIDEGCLHQAFLSDGVLSPIVAKMKLEKPIVSAEVKNHDELPMMSAHIKDAIVYLTPFLKRTHIDKQFTAR